MEMRRLKVRGELLVTIQAEIALDLLQAERPNEAVGLVANPTVSARKRFMRMLHLLNEILVAPDARARSLCPCASLELAARRAGQHYEAKRNTGGGQNASRHCSSRLSQKTVHGCPGTAGWCSPPICS